MKSVFQEHFHSNYNAKALTGLEELHFYKFREFCQKKTFYTPPKWFRNIFPATSMSRDFQAFSFKENILVAPD